MSHPAPGRDLGRGPHLKALPDTVRGIFSGRTPGGSARLVDVFVHTGDYAGVRVVGPVVC
jgi:hypothetical protein